MTEQITVDISSLTNRVDALQAALQLIQQTIPVSLPEFTTPVPTAVDFTAVLTSLNEIKTAILANQPTDEPPIMQQQQLQPLSLVGSAVTLSGWNSQTPENLGFILDGDLMTGSTAGRVTSNGTKGWFTVELPKPVIGLFTISCGVRLNGGNTGRATWMAGCSANLNPETMLPTWSCDRWQPGNTLVTTKITFWGVGNWLHIGCMDVGEGEPELSILDIKCLELLV